jgi:putative hydrolase of HD superfamily
MVAVLLTSGAAPSVTQRAVPSCTGPIQVVQAQVDAYNHHDLETFLATYAPDAELRPLPTDSASIIGQAALRRAYEFLGRVPPEFGVDITERIAAGCFVIDHERLKATDQQPAKEVGVAIYQVEGRMIRRVWFTTM